MKKISNEMLDRAYLEAATPVKSMTTHAASIAKTVGILKAAREMGMDAGNSWVELRGILDSAMQSGDWSALDDLAKLWPKVESRPMKIVIKTSAHPDPRTLPAGGIANPPRQPITRALVIAIRRLQEGKNRAPTRQEILDEMNLILVNGVGETELTRQLTRLGWNDLI